MREGEQPISGNAFRTVSSSTPPGRLSPVRLSKRSSQIGCSKYAHHFGLNRFASLGEQLILGNHSRTPLIYFCPRLGPFRCKSQAAGPIWLAEPGLGADGDRADQTSLTFFDPPSRRLGHRTAVRWPSFPAGALTCPLAPTVADICDRFVTCALALIVAGGTAARGN